MSETLTLELIERIAEEVISDLERDALRTIRQRDLERGKSILDQTEGVRHFLEDLRRAAGSSIYRMSGHVREIASKNQKRRLPKPTPVVCPMRRVEKGPS